MESRLFMFCIMKKKLILSKVLTNFVLNIYVVFLYDLSFDYLIYLIKYFDINEKINKYL